MATNSFVETGAGDDDYVSRKQVEQSSLGEQIGGLSQPQP